MTSESTLHRSLIYRIALTKVTGVGNIIARQLLNTFHNETNIFEWSTQELISRGVSPRIASQLKNPACIEWAKKEAEFIRKQQIKTLFISDESYPSRLKECVDAPILLYYRGECDFNAQKMISIVGTRSATSYANTFCTEFIKELSVMFPHLIIVSGLAYGVDILAHRNALLHGLHTVGVVAHGLDRIYPSAHKNTAREMEQRGAIISEFPSTVQPDRYNFVKRNRIVAGMSDAVIVIESAASGGSLITADIASSYYRDVFALPGRTSDKQSEGCNLLIAENKASLLQSAELFVRQMGWGQEVQTEQKAICSNKQLHLYLNEEEQKIHQVLSLSNNQELHIDLLAIQTELSLSTLSFALLEMEMKGLVRACPGGIFKLT